MSDTHAELRPARPQASVDARLERARDVLRLEARTLGKLEERLDERFSQVVERVLACRGMVLVTGMGKAGLIGAKISATLASTGTPSINLHPGEAMHGDLGRVGPEDLLLVLSNSGETAEIVALIPPARRIGAGVVAMTGRPDSTLGRLADLVLDLGEVDEACPLGLAPTASTAAMLALGDALAMVVLEERGFSREDYARFHPGGSLGRRLLRVADVMRRSPELPLVGPAEPVRGVILTMSRTPGRPGAALVVDERRRLLGIFTDGDLRRLLEEGETQVLDRPVEASMGREPKSVTPEALVDDAERILRENRVDQVPVVDAEGRAVGLVDVQDLLPTHL